MKKILLLLSVTATLFACKKDEEKNNEIYKGAVVQVHGGKAWTWAKVKKNGQPEQIAITMNDAVLNTVPTTVEDEGGSGHNHQNNLQLPLHPKAIEATPFKFLGLDWNPIGHEPEDIYTVSHFDLHFYMNTIAEQLAATDMAKLQTQPPTGYVPANHIAGAPVPTMGLHWIDAASPELGGTVPFTQTFIYGSYNGKINFYEPMITLQFLKTTNNFERSIPQPEKFAKDGYYPTKMRISKHDGVTDVILEGFVEREAS